MTINRRCITAIALAGFVCAGSALFWLTARPEHPVATAVMTRPYEYTVWTPPSETLEGTLDVSDEGCVVLRRPSGDLLLVAEGGSALLDGGTRVKVSSVGTFTLGQRISQGGNIVEVRRTGKRFTPPQWDQCVGSDVRTVEAGSLSLPD